MSNILFQDDEFKVTVTDDFLIIRDSQVDIGEIYRASYTSVEGFKGFLMGIASLIIAIIMILTFSWWSLVGLLPLGFAYIMFFGKNYLIHIGLLEEEGCVENDILCTRKQASNLCKAINEAVAKKRAG